MKKSFTGLLVFSAFLIGLNARTVNAAEDILVAKENIIHNLVSGYFDFTLNPNPVNANTLRVATTCPNMVRISSVEYTTTPNQTYFETTQISPGGFIKQSGNKFYSLRLTFYNPTYVAVTCGWEVYAGKPGTNVEDEELLGVLKFGGGYADRVKLKATPSRIIKSIRIAIPTYCKDTDILEAGTMTENVFDAAELVNSDSHLYSVNNGAGMRASSIGVSFNGPPNLTCTIPVYVNKN